MEENREFGQMPTEGREYGQIPPEGREYGQIPPAGRDYGQIPPERPVRWRGFKLGFLLGALAMLAAMVLVLVGAQMATTFRITGRLNLPDAGELLASAADDLTGSGQNSALTDKLARIDELIDQYFIFDVDRNAMTDKALAGYISGLDDVYSGYYTPQEYRDTMEESDGTYTGIGVAVQQDPETLAVTVLTVYPGSPAEGAGIEKGDILAKVDGEDIAEWNLTDIVSRIRGKEGTEVVVTVNRNGELIDTRMTRRVLDKITVESRMLEEGTGYLQLTEFDTVSITQLEKAVDDLKAQGMTGLILDLRDNPGGLLTSVVNIADDFLGKSDILYIDDKQGNRSTYSAEDGAVWDGPMVVLINGNSASASEVLSGALQDNNRAIVVGEQSFGKGIVQTFFTLNDGSGIKLTTAHYSTPGGRDIHGVGITPDLGVEDDAETEADEQLDAALEEIRRLQ